MNGYKVGFLVTAAGLVASISLQLWPRSTPPVHAAAALSSSADASAPACSSVDATAETLTTELRACRNRSWELVEELFAAAQSEEETWSRRLSVVDEGATPFEEQQRELCDIASEEAWNHWKREKDGIVAGLQREVGTPAWVEQDIDKKITAHRERFELNDADAARLERRYAGLWEEHASVIRELLHDEDWAGLMDAVRELWRDEDTLVGDVLGAERGEGYRATELRSRTAIMAILATFGDLPWDESIAW